MKFNLKRALAAAAVLSVGTLAFAQLTVSGYYRGGVADLTNTSGSNSIGIVDRLRLNLAYSAADDMFGFKARLDATSASDGVTTGWANLLTKNGASVRYSQGYVKFLDGSLKVTGGKLDITDYYVSQNTGNYYLGNVSTESWILGKYLIGNQKGNTTGGILQVFPIEGLSVAASVVTDNTAPDLHNFGVHAYYLTPEVGKAILNAKAGSTSGDTASNQLYKGFASVGYQYTGFAGLSATGAYRYNNGDSGLIAIVEYTQGPLFCDVSLDSDFTAGHFYTEGEVSYTVIPQLKVRAYGAYADTKSYAGTNIALIAGSVNSGIGNQYLVGGDLVFPVGKAEVVTGVAYGDQAGTQIPVMVKVNF